MFNISQTQFNLANDLMNQFNTAQFQLTLAANNLLIQLRNVPGANISVIQSFLTSIQNQLNTNVRQLVSTYSPGNVMNYIMNAYQGFIANLSATSVEVQTLNNLYLTKIFNPKAQDCMTNYTQSTFAIYSAASKNYTTIMQNETVQIQAQLSAIRNDIVQQVQTMVSQFRNSAQNPSTAVQTLLQFVSSSNTNFLLISSLFFIPASIVATIEFQCNRK